MRKHMRHYLKKKSSKLEKSWYTYVPDYKIYSVGVIRGVDAETTIEELEEAIRLKYPNAKAERITKLDSEGTNERVPTTAVKIWFPMDTIPQEIHACQVKSNVEWYIPNVMQCQKCWQFNHKANECRKKAKCKSCRGSHTQVTCWSKTLKCANCSQNHMANDRKCPKYIEEKEIRMTAAREHISIYEARSNHRASTHNHYRQTALNHT